MEDKLRDLEQRTALVVMEKEQLQEDREEQIKARVQIDLIVKDLEETESQSGQVLVSKQRVEGS